MTRHHPLLRADCIYRSIAEARITQHPVDEDPVRHFAHLLREFEREAGPAASHDAWRVVLARLRRYRFNLAAAPVPSNHPDIQPGGMLTLLDRMVQICGASYPVLESRATSLLEVVTKLCEEPHNPLGNALASYVKEQHDMAPVLLLKERRHVSIAEKILRGTLWAEGIADVEVTALVPGDFGDACYRRLYVIGAARWFPRHVFQAPRAGEVHVFSFRWLRDAIPAEGVFPATLSRRGGVPTIRTTGGNPTREIETAVIEAEEIEPVHDWGHILRSGFQRSKDSEIDQSEEIVVARTYLLEDGYAVFLDAESDRTVLTLNIRDHEHPVPKRIKIRDLGPGSFVLLRTEGSGDYIIPVADTLLGEHAERVREMQREWKHCLKQEIKKRGDYGAVAAKLRSLGGHRANEVNLRNWVSERSIRTEAREDFDAIMQLTGLEERADKFWKAMAMIDSAHRRAGRHIRRQLLQKVVNVSTDELERAGVMHFELDSADGGRLTAFRVLEAAPETAEVPYHLLNAPFPWEE